MSSGTCPKNISPCSCRDALSFDEKTVSLSCGRFLSDAQLSKILDAFQADGISPLSSIGVEFSDEIKKIPDQLASKFPKISNVEFKRLSNSIVLSSGAFSFTESSEVFLSFIDSGITSISSGAFNFPKAKYISLIFFGSKNLKTIAADAIKSEYYRTNKSLNNDY